MVNECDSTTPDQPKVEKLLRRGKIEALRAYRITTWEDEVFREELEVLWEGQTDYEWLSLQSLIDQDREMVRLRLYLGRSITRDVLDQNHNYY